MWGVLRDYARKGGKPFAEFEGVIFAQACLQELRKGLKGRLLKPFGGGGNSIVLTGACGYGAGGVIFEPTGEGWDEVADLTDELTSKQIVSINSKAFNGAEMRRACLRRSYTP